MVLKTSKKAEIRGEDIWIPHREKLVEGRVIRRPNRFIVLVEVDGVEYEAHCPTTGSIGGLKLDGFRCLLHGPHDTEKRRTAWTLEAVSPWDDNSWIGVDQSYTNRVIGRSLEFENFSKTLGFDPEEEIKPEVKVGSSRIDFEVGNRLLEVKTLVGSYIGWRELPEWVQVKEIGQSVDRMHRQIENIMETMDESSKEATMLSVHLYPARPFQPPVDNPAYGDFVKLLKRARRAGFEQWSVQIEQNAEGSLVHFPVRREFLED